MNEKEKQLLFEALLHILVYINCNDEKDASRSRCVENLFEISDYRNKCIGVCRELENERVL